MGIEDRDDIAGIAGLSALSAPEGPGGLEGGEGMKARAADGPGVQIRDRIRGFILDYIGQRELGNDEDIFERGYATSMFAMELVTFVEGEFGIAIENEDLELSNFSTVDALARLVVAKASQHGQWTPPPPAAELAP